MLRSMKELKDHEKCTIGATNGDADVANLAQAAAAGSQVGH